MELVNMNFRDFVEKDKTRVPVKKQVQPVKTVNKESIKRVPIQQEEYEDEEILDESEYYYEDEEMEEYYEEPVRKVVKQPVRRVVQKTYRPTPTRTNYAMSEEQYRRPLSISQKQLQENTIEGTATSLTEAIKRKVDTIFYRFGIQGLEKLDEKILDTIEELQYPTEPRKQLKEMKRITPKKIIKRVVKPLPLEDVEPIRTPPKEIYEEPIEQEPVKVVSSPKPKFMKPITVKEEQPTETISESLDDEDIVNAVMSMDFGPEKETITESMSDDEMWNTAEAILETTPTKELIHEPQSQSVLQQIPEPIVEEQLTETIVEEQIEEPIKKPKRAKKIKQEIENIEENNTNEEK